MTTFSEDSKPPTKNTLAILWVVIVTTLTFLLLLAHELGY